MGRGEPSCYRSHGPATACWPTPWARWLGDRQRAPSRYHGMLEFGRIKLKLRAENLNMARSQAVVHHVTDPDHAARLLARLVEDLEPLVGLGEQGIVVRDAQAIDGRVPAATRFRCT